MERDIGGRQRVHMTGSDADDRNISGFKKKRNIFGFISCKS